MHGVMPRPVGIATALLEVAAAVPDAEPLAELDVVLCAATETVKRTRDHFAFNNIISVNVKVWVRKAHSDQDKCGTTFKNIYVNTNYFLAPELHNDQYPTNDADNTTCQRRQPRSQSSHPLFNFLK